MVLSHSALTKPNHAFLPTTTKVVAAEVVVAAALVDPEAVEVVVVAAEAELHQTLTQQTILM